MSEKKEKQWAVLKYDKHLHGPITGFPLKITWYDSRKIARERAAELNKKSKKYEYFVHPMTRGPGA